jgi:hypothetical protein
MNPTATCSAFHGTQLIAAGALAEVSAAALAVTARPHSDPVLIFDDATGRVIDVDLADASAPAELPRGPGRPKLGVVAREVTLLPHHWEWLAQQPGGASVNLRKLVEHARRANEGHDRVRQARDAVYRFASTMAGNAPGYEEALRALFAGDGARFRSCTLEWPADVRTQALRMSEGAFKASDANV